MEVYNDMKTLTGWIRRVSVILCPGGSRTVALFLVTAMVLVVLSGCYWTSGESEGGLTLQINPPRGFHPLEIEDPYGFLMAYVVEESVLLAGPAAAEQLFDQIELSIEQEFEAFFESYFELFQQDLSEEEFEREIRKIIDRFRIDLEYPSAQFQGQYFTFRKNATGSNSFRGLNAGSRYLVVVTAFGSDYESEIDAEAIGYTRTTIRSGETRTVKLDLDNNWKAFEDDLFAWYGVEIEEEEPATIRIVLTENQQSYFSGSPLYYDLLDPDTTSFQAQYYFLDEPAWSQLWSDWYGPAIVWNSIAEPIEKTGNRSPLAPVDGEDFTFEITGVISDRSWKILVTTWASRGDTDAEYEYAALFETEEATVSGGTVTTTVVPANASGAPELVNVELYVGT